MTDCHTSTQDVHARQSCAQGQHRWRSIWREGEFVCLRCGMRALCPRCLLVLPGTPVALLLCARHRAQEQEQQPKGARA